MEVNKLIRSHYTIEIIFIALCLLAFTRSIWNPSPQMQLRGREFTYLVNSGAIAAEVFERTGKIPLWNPLMGRGEPLLENPFSFVLNPLMTLPIFALGPIQGAKLAAVLHILLMGIGGWALAYVLQLGLPGRLLLGLLLGGSGSMAGAIGTGFYQMGLSQAYVPWIYAGLIGTLNFRNRRYVGMLVISAVLLIFAGTFWYVLPTAIACVLIISWHIATIRSKPDFWAEVPKIVMRLIWAAVFILGLSAVRLLPQMINHNYVIHPPADLRFRQNVFFTMASLLFKTQLPDDLSITTLFYHYIIPPSFALLILLTWLISRKIWQYPPAPANSARHSPHNIIFPAVVLILLFTIWSQEGIPLVRWFYHEIPLLAEWRFLGRILAAASPWLIILMVVLFDEIIMAGWHSKRVGKICAVVFIILGVASAVDVMKNWERVADTVPDSSYTRPPLNYLRSQHPNEFLSVLTWNYFSDYLPFYETLSRTTFGNPDYQPGALESTIGTQRQMQFFPEYAIPGDDADREFVMEHGYTADLSYYFSTVLYQNNSAPSYAFLIDPAELVEPPDIPIVRTQTVPVSYFHRMDSIIVTLQNSHTHDLLVIQETAYPGWKVHINGEAAPLESVGGLLGVRLSETSYPIQVIFSYQPIWYYRGALITIITTVFFTLYVLKQSGTNPA